MILAANEIFPKVEKKNNNKLCLIIDYYKLNKIIWKDAYLLLQIDELINYLGKVSIFSTLDMYSGFY